MNFTAGGLLGYCSSNCMISLNVPSSKGVSEGPMMTAFLNRLYQYIAISKTDERDKPGHDVIGDRRGADSGRSIGLHSLVM
jgi:hypothetical protein